MIAVAGCSPVDEDSTGAGSGRSNRPPTALTREEVEEAVALKGFTHARLSCGCRLTFRDGIEGSRLTVVIDRKSPGCAISLHVQDAPLFDYREALRPSTRLGSAEEEEYEEEG